MKDQGPSDIRYTQRMVILMTEIEQFSKALFHVSGLKRLIVLEVFIAFIRFESLKFFKISSSFFLLPC